MKVDSLHALTSVTVGNNNVYHAGNKPSAADIGALPASGKATDADKLDGLDGTSYVRYGSGSYSQILGKNGSASDWLRTTSNGLLPNADNSGSLGTSSWRFSSIYGNNIYEGTTALSAKYLGINANAASATKLATARTISGVSFDGTANISLNAGHVGAIPVNTSSGTPVAAYLTSGGTNTTGIKIRLPYKTNATKMVAFNVKVYQNYNVYDVMFSGYLYSTSDQWYLPKAYLVAGSGSIEVSMGKDDDGFAYVWLAGANYKGVAVFNVVGGYGGANWNTGWSITESNERPNTALTTTLQPPYSNVNKPTAAEIGAVQVSDNKVIIPAFSGTSAATLKTQKVATGGADDKETWMTDKPDSVSGHKGIGIQTTLGPLYWNGTASKRIYNEDFKPTATDVGLSYISQSSTSGLVISLNGKTTSMGNRNASWSHFETNATDGFYFYQNVNALNLASRGTVSGVAVNSTGAASGQGLAYNGKTAIGGVNDGWLRVNPHNQFSSGIYCGSTGTLRHDGSIQAGGWASSVKGAKMQVNHYDSSWAGNGTASFSTNNPDSSGAHWLIASYYDGSNIRSGIQVLSNTTGNMRFYTNRRSSYVEFNGSTITGTLHGTANAANTLATARLIGGVSFNGSADIVPTNINPATSTSASFYNMAWFSGTRIYHTNGLLQVQPSTGALTSSNNLTAYSDVRIKDDIKNIPDALAKVMKLNGVTYTRTDLEDKQKRHTGVIAQEVEAVLPEAVSTLENGEIKDFKAVAYGNLVGLLIEAIKELKGEIEELKNGIPK